MITKDNRPLYSGVILALDGATRKTGFALYRNGKVIKSGVWKLPLHKWQRVLFTNITATIKQYNVTLVVAEDYYKDKGRDRNKDTAFDRLAQCRGVIETAAQVADVEFKGTLPPVQVKHEIWGYTTANRFHAAMTYKEHKQRMCAAITAKGFTLSTENADDEADAIGLLLAWLSLNKYAEPKPKGKGTTCK